MILTFTVCFGDLSFAYTHDFENLTHFMRSMQPFILNSFVIFTPKG